MKTATVLNKKIAMATRELAEHRMVMLRAAKRGCKLAYCWTGDGPPVGPFGIYVSAETLTRWNAGIAEAKIQGLDADATLALRLEVLRGSSEVAT